MASWTSPADVVGAWIGEGAPDDDTLTQIWIGKAEREIRRKVPGIQDRIDAEAELVPPKTDLLEDAIDVTAAMVTRKMQNPRGVRQRNVTTGPFTESETMGGDIPGELALTDDELSKLIGVVSSGAFTISMIPTTSPFYGG